jgi:hypothetical protein
MKNNVLLISGLVVALTIGGFVVVISPLREANPIVNKIDIPERENEVDIVFQPTSTQRADKEVAQTAYVSTINNITFFIPDSWRNYNYTIEDNVGDLYIEFIADNGVEVFLLGLVRDNLENYIIDTKNSSFDIRDEKWYFSYRGARGFVSETDSNVISQMDSDVREIIIPSVREYVFQ